MRNTAKSSGPFRHPPTWNTLLDCDTVKNFAVLTGFLSWLWAYAFVLKAGAINGNISVLFFLGGGR